MTLPAERAVRAAAPSPYVFVVGCPRSGTTLLQRMLDAHPELAVANDTHFVARAVKAVVPELAAGRDVALSAAEERGLIDWSIAYRRFPRLGLPAAAVERAAAAGSFVEFVAALYRELALERGKRFGGEKTPDYVRCLPLLDRLFPATPVIHIVRDGRDVALSLMEWANGEKGPGRFPLWREEPVAVAALWWRWQVSSGRRAAARLPAGRVHELRYERLVAAPREELAPVAAFLGLGEVEAMLDYHRGKRRTAPGLSAKSAWLPPTPGLRDFEHEMAEDDRALFEALAGDLLDELGYRRTVAPERLEESKLAARAARCRERFERERSEGRRKRAAGGGA